MTTDNCMTITDSHGASIVFERDFRRRLRVPHDCRGGCLMLTPVDLLNRAEEVAPQPESRDASVEEWIRHHAATALAAFAGLEQAQRTVNPDAERGSRPELGYLGVLAVSAMSAAAALSVPTEDAAALLWELTPESGALNGEWEEWLTATLDRLGVNPADVDPRFTAGDFRSPSRFVEVAR